MKSGVIYVATNTVNGDQYVGLTRIGVAIRWSQHCTNARNPKTYFHRAIAKYGASAFAVSEYASALDLTHLADLERAVIIQLAPAYNQTCGGEVTFGRKYDDKTKERIRQKNIGRTWNSEQKARMSQIKQANYQDNPDLRRLSSERLRNTRSQWENKRIAAVTKSAKERIWSEEARKKLSASCMGRTYDADVIAKMSESKKRKVRCDTTGNVYSCRVAAAEACGVSPQSVFRVCNGKYPSVKGLKFSYVR